MVRRLVGTIVEAGRGNVKPDEISFLLDNKAPLLFKERGKPSKLDPAKYTAPPSGLFLEKIFY
jgi:tRNA pseudouridine38-40 synthase